MIANRTVNRVLSILGNTFRESFVSSTQQTTVDILPNQLLSLNPKFSRYSVGRFSYGCPAPIIIDDLSNPQATFKIGSFCSVGPNVTVLLGHEHRIDWVTTYPFSCVFDGFDEIVEHSNALTNGSVTIGNDVWIGMNAFILDDVNVSSGAIVGACSVVTKDVEPYTIVAGNPARVVGKRFDEKTISKLLQISWWDWSIERIKENMTLLLSNRITEFIERNYFSRDLTFGSK
jgi:virginiamycin A acetyltransferase